MNKSVAVKNWEFILGFYFFEIIEMYEIDDIIKNNIFIRTNKL